MTSPSPDTIVGVAAESAAPTASHDSVVRNSAWMMLSQGAAIAINSGITIFAIRIVSTDAWGRYSTALALIAILTVVSELGVASLALREMSNDGAAAQTIYGTATMAIVGTAAIAAILIGPIVYLFHYSSRTTLLVFAAAPLLLLQPLLALLQAVFNARRALRYVARYQAVQYVVYAAIALPLLVLNPSVGALVLASVASAAAALVVGTAIARRRLDMAPALAGAWRRALPFVRSAIPIGGIGVITIVYDRLDVLMLSKLGNSVAVAHYSVPYNLVKMSWLVPSIISAAFFPLLNAQLRDRPTEARKQFFLVVRVFFLLSLPMSLFLAVGSSDLVPFVFGARYASSVLVLQIMAWTSVLGFQNYVFWYGILAARQERRVVVIQVVGLVVNAALNVVLIPRYGSSGAAATLVTSDLIVVLAQVVLVHRHLFAIPFRDVTLKPALVAAVAVPLSLAVATRSAIGGASTGAALYVVLLIATGYISKAEWQPIVQPIVARLPGRGGASR